MVVVKLVVPFAAAHYRIASTHGNINNVYVCLCVYTAIMVHALSSSVNTIIKCLFDFDLPTCCSPFWASCAAYYYYCCCGLQHCVCACVTCDRNAGRPKSYNIRLSASEERLLWSFEDTTTALFVHRTNNNNNN